MKIKIFVNDDTYSALQIWNFYYAYRQALNHKSNYQSDIEIVFATGSDLEIDKSCVNVGWFYMPDSIDSSADQFDVIFVDNLHHPLEVCTEAMFEAIVHRPNCYLVSGAYVDPLHPYYNKIVRLTMWFIALGYYTSPFYPQYFQKFSTGTFHRQQMIFVNGQNRMHRQFFMTKLHDQCPAIPIKSSLSTLPEKLCDCFFESEEDAIFRKMLNDAVPNFDALDHENENEYYNQSVIVGINGSHGRVPPGYFMLEEYLQYHCVIFPESGWINSQLFMTEKILKCVISRCIPWPIGGAFVHEYYNRVGFGTAWNLLPSNLKKFDSCTDHALRYELQAQAIKWAYEHPEIWHSDTAREIIDSNHQICFHNDFETEGVVKIESILDSVKSHRNRPDLP
jgi:hypothetical protein